MRLPSPILITAALALACLGLPAPGRAADAAPPAAPAPVAAKAPEAADAPAPKLGKDGQPEKRFISMHEGFLKRGADGPVGVLFLGDSITEGWGKAKDVWEAHYGAQQPANFGIGGDRTQHVLWRIANGELDHVAPKVVVLMIGTNNLGRNTPAEIAAADTRIVAAIHAKLPKTKVLLLAVFPRATSPTDGKRAEIATINESLAKLDDGAATRYLDFGKKFLAEDGTLPKDIMPDALHPNAKGYAIWADAMQPLLDEMLK